MSTIVTQLRGPTENPTAVNITFSTSALTSTIDTATPTVSASGGIITLAGAGFVSGTTVTVGGTAGTSVSVNSEGSELTFVNQANHTDGTLHHILVVKPFVDLTPPGSDMMVATDDNFHETITVTFTLDSTSEDNVTLSSLLASNGATVSFSSNVLTVSGGLKQVNEHLETIRATNISSFTSNYTIAVSISDGSNSVDGTITINNTSTTATLPNGYKENTTLVWTTGAGALTSVDENTAVSISVVATDADGQGITYTISSGSLPTGLTLSTAGAITGTTGQVAVDTTSSFTVSATDGFEAVTRAFTLTVQNVSYSFGVEKTASSAGDGDKLGNSPTSVSADGELVIAGAPFFNLSGDADNGRVVVFKTADSGSTWTQQQSISPDDALGSKQGRSTGLSGNLLAFGGDRYSTPYVYVYKTADSGATWTEQVRIVGPTNINFGYAIALDSSTLAIGAPNHAFGSNGEVYIYTTANSGASWSLQQTLTTTGSAGSFGRSIALHGDRLVISQPNQNKIYLYTRSGSTWTSTATFTPSGTQNGKTVAIYNEYFAYTTFYTTSGDTGSQVDVVRDLGGGTMQTQANIIMDANEYVYSIAIGEDSSDNRRLYLGCILESGASPTQQVKVYGSDGDSTGWSLVNTINPVSTPSANNSFGRSIAVTKDDLDYLVVGSPNQDANSKGSIHIYKDL